MKARPLHYHVEDLDRPCSRLNFVRFCTVIFCFSCLPAKAQIANPESELSASQIGVPAVTGIDRLTIDQPSVLTPTDPIHIEQPSVTRVPPCQSEDISGANVDCSTEFASPLIKPAPAATAEHVEVGDKGLYLVPESRKDVYDPDEIARLLGSAEPLQPNAYGAGGVALEAFKTPDEIFPVDGDTHSNLTEGTEDNAE